MRKPITTQEAERIVCNGGEVWRGKLSYKIVRGLLCQICEIYGEGIPWSEFNLLSNFEAEIEMVDLPDEYLPHSKEKPSAATAPSDPRWMTPGQAVDWMASHIGEYLEDDVNGTMWRIPCVHGEIIARHEDFDVTKLSLPVIYNRRFRVPVANKPLPRLPAGCEWIRENSQVVSVREPNPLLGDTYTMVLQNQKSRDICAALVQLWDQEHTSK